MRKRTALLLLVLPLPACQILAGLSDRSAGEGEGTRSVDGGAGATTTQGVSSGGSAGSANGGSAGSANGGSAGSAGQPDNSSSNTGGSLGGPCTFGLTPCDGGCVNIDSDRRHCGQCFRACAAGNVCESGSCKETASGTGGEAGMSGTDGDGSTSGSNTTQGGMTIDPPDPQSELRCGDSSCHGQYCCFPGPQSASEMPYCSDVPCEGAAGVATCDDAADCPGGACCIEGRFSASWVTCRESCVEPEREVCSVNESTEQCANGELTCQAALFPDAQSVFVDYLICDV